MKLPARALCKALRRNALRQRIFALRTTVRTFFELVENKEKASFSKENNEKNEKDKKKE